jgi:AcrR family transcriptional regulator
MARAAGPTAAAGDTGRWAGVGTDRAAAVRHALCRLVARHGFHGASMAAVAKEAGVATGTAYVHYGSKDDLVVAAYRELKQELSRAAAEALTGLGPDAEPARRFRTMWLAVHRWLRAEPDRARFLLQVDASPYAALALEAAADGEQTLTDQAAMADMQTLLRPLPAPVLYDLAFGPLLRVVAAERVLTDPEVDELAEACWRSVTVPGSA